MDITIYKENIKKAAMTIRSKWIEKPETCIVVGSGLSSLADSLEDPIELLYADIPGFPQVSVLGHEGKMLFGRMNDVPILILKGRFHYYEGHPIEDVVFPIRVMLELGIRSIILTCAAGSLDIDMKPGDLMIIKDHIGLFCESPLRGPNFDEYGPRFPDQSSVYQYEEVIELAKELNIPAYPGIYAYCKGPMYETTAETSMLKHLGANAVGMSTVPEAIVASHGGMKVVGIACITNHATGITDKPLTHSEVLEVGKRSTHYIKELIFKMISEI